MVVRVRAWAAMNPNACRLRLRPRDPLELVDLLAVFVRSCGGAFLAWTAVCVGPAWLLCVALLWLSGGSPWVLLLPLFVAPLVQAVFTVLGGRLLFAEVAPAREVLGGLFTAAPALFGVWLARVAGLLAGALTCGLGVPLAQAGLIFSTEAALLERVGPGRAARRSLRLAAGEPGAAVAATIAWWAITLWFGLIGEWAGQGLVRDLLLLGQPFGAVLEGEATPWLVAGFLIAQPVHSWYRLLVYVDARTRAEGWDLQVALRAAALDLG